MMPSVTIFSIEIMSTLKEIKYYLKQSYHKQKSYPLPYPTPNLSYPIPYSTLPYPLPYATLPPTLPYPILYPALPLTYPTPYHTLYPTLPYLPLTYPTLPYPTLPYPVPYSALPNPVPCPTLSYPTLYPTLPSLPYSPPTIPYPIPTPYPTLNRPVNLPSMYLSHVRYSLMSISVSSCVIFGLFWSVSLRSRLFWSVSVNYDTALTWNPGLGLVKLYRLKPSYNNNMATEIRSRLLCLHLRTSLIDLLFTSASTFVCPTQRFQRRTVSAL